MLFALIPAFLAINQAAAHLEPPAAKRVNDHHNKLVDRQGTPTLSTLLFPTFTTTVTLAPGTLIPSLSAIVSGGSVEAGLPLPTTYAAGAVPPLKGAVGLPSISVPMPTGVYPAPDFIPPVDSPEVLQWMKELDGHNIPDIGLTISSDNNCVTNAAAAADKSRCWWTCGGCTAPTDITVCPDKSVWGVSFDDGPSTYTPKLLNFLSAKSLKATFFVVGSRIFYNPHVLRAEYMEGHQISVHTWSHPALTNLTNAQIVAELGWSRKIIKDVLGVTPRTFRPPYGDVDNRVRAIASAMGFQTIIWTGVGDDQYDTDDWKVPGGKVNGQQSFDAFNEIISKATQLTTGFIVLAHDLYQETVDMSVGYFVPTALSGSNPFTLKPINECLHVPLTDVYLETNTNSTTGGGGGSSSSVVGSTATVSGSKTVSGSNTATSTKSSATTSTSASSTNGALGRASVGSGIMLAGMAALVASLVF